MGKSIYFKVSTSREKDTDLGDEVSQYLESIGATHVRQKHPDVLPGIWSATVPDDADVEVIRNTLQKLLDIDSADADPGREIM